MRQMAPSMRLERSVLASHRLHPCRWLLARRRDGEDGSAFAFGIRLLATVVLTFALTGITGYLLLERNMAHQLIHDYAEGQRADARAFELEGSRATSTADGIGDIQRLLEGVAQRPGTLAASLIDQQHAIRAAGNRALVGKMEADARIDAALRHGDSYAGREGDRGEDSSDFEFIVPVDLPSGRYAYEVTYDHHTYDAQLSELRTVLALIALFTLIGGGTGFYLLGGRRLMRDHRVVLQRATRDGLTDLPNQRAFQDELPQAVASAARYDDHFALALLDVDDFKLINDRHGHPHGDAILQSVAQVLREARPGDRPYRIGGDEFALSLTHTDAEGARAVARRLSRNLQDAGINASVGVSALRPGQQADTLRAEADAALYEAKREGGNRATHFEDIRERVVVTTSEKKEAVVRLIEEGRLETLFQPIWNLDAQTLLGVEALTRPDPSYGLSGPAELFDIAEQIGRVHQLDVLCVENALRVAPQLHPGVLLFLNLSPLTLDLDAEADAWLAPAVKRAGLTPQAIVVEVTERSGGRTERGHQAAQVPARARLQTRRRRCRNGQLGPRDAEQDRRRVRQARSQHHHRRRNRAERAGSADGDGDVRAPNRSVRDRRGHREPGHHAVPARHQRRARTRLRCDHPRRPRLRARPTIPRAHARLARHTPRRSQSRPDAWQLTPSARAATPASAPMPGRSQTVGWCVYL
jgi:diguanylate cyclase (GGDEF)-like protein